MVGKLSDFLSLITSAQSGLWEVSHLTTARWHWSWRLFPPLLFSLL